MNKDIKQSITADPAVSSPVPKEIIIIAMATIRDILGWEEKTLLFHGKTLVDFLKQIVDLDGKTLYDDLVQEDGAVRPEYTIWLNKRQLRQGFHLNICLRTGDRVTITPVMKFAAGG
ncbi:MAG TPA: hypothetical protein PLG17_07835 [Thermodesulfobacteriota bacterium]|nr:hypothetical protein [Deltaproteobacteria bacterium]HNR12535.1 hypothetical protein [Thermodesulfobacteriota bacterium]HNU72339.1 hypothetical protein [Thermodesulfobacteriota bacterium]HQO78408.1 hypothetical protein [Thermodesulfobacteriota bacterium]